MLQTYTTGWLNAASQARLPSLTLTRYHGSFFNGKKQAKTTIHFSSVCPESESKVVQPTESEQPRMVTHTCLCLDSKITYIALVRLDSVRMSACGLDLSLVSTLFMNILFSTDKQELKRQVCGKEKSDVYSS